MDLKVIAGVFGTGLVIGWLFLGTLISPVKASYESRLEERRFYYEQEIKTICSQAVPRPGHVIPECGGR